MSEQTPNSTEDLNGAEPSMEDILASIRKIISDDEPVAMESPEDVAGVDLADVAPPSGLDDLMQDVSMGSGDLTSDAVRDANILQSEPFSAEGESVDLNIEDVLAGLDEDLVEPEALNEAGGAESFLSTAEAAEVEDFIPEMDIVSETNIVPETDNDILSFLDADIPLGDETSAEPAAFSPKSAAAPLAAVAAATVGFATGASDDVQETSDDVEMGALLDDILMTTDEVEPELDAGSELDTGDVFETGFADNTSELEQMSAEESDLDLVKSLMADLADDPDGVETEEDLDSLLAIPELPEEVEGLDLDLPVEAQEELDIEDQLNTLDNVVEAPVADDLSLADGPEAEEDILGDILDMTIEDELESHPDEFQTEELSSLDAVLDAELDNIAENEMPLEEALMDESAADIAEDDLPSLSEIAAAAEADALAAETAAAPAPLAAAGWAAATGGVVAGASTLGLRTVATDEPQAETEIAETEITETLSELTAEPSDLTPEPYSTTQETSMPVKAVKTDAILDEVTETAAAGAFAELNQVVEDKAVFNESGPRIGDLVQDALRPMLKEWLDANLKGIVERAVTKEVKRISKGQ